VRGALWFYLPLVRESTGSIKLRTVASVVVFGGHGSVNFDMFMTFKSFNQQIISTLKNKFYFVKLIYSNNYVKIWMNQPGHDIQRPTSLT